MFVNDESWRCRERVVFVVHVCCYGDDGWFWHLLLFVMICVVLLSYLAGIPSVRELKSVDRGQYQTICLHLIRRSQESMSPNEVTTFVSCNRTSSDGSGGQEMVNWSKIRRFSLVSGYQ